MFLFADLFAECSLTYKNYSAPMRCIQTISPGQPISAVAVYDKYLFLAFDSSGNIRVYHSDTLAQQSTISITREEYPRVNPVDMVATVHGLYVCDYKNTVIHRVRMLDLSISAWPVLNVAAVVSMSVTRKNNVMVTSSNKLLEYTPTGAFVRQIALPVNTLSHSVDAGNGNFVVCYGRTWLEAHRVCIVDGAGNQKQEYGKGLGGGSTTGTIDKPSHLAIDENGFIFVADRENKRIVLLNPRLDFVSELSSENDDHLDPYRMCLDDRQDRLHVVCRNKKRLLIFSAC